MLHWRMSHRFANLSKQILTTIASQFFIAISVPLNVYAAECKLFGVRIAGDDFFETSNFNTSTTFDEDQKQYHLRLWMMFHFI